MPEEVDVDLALKVFQRFSVEPDTLATGAAPSGGEPYMPTCFLAVAAREMGYYPTNAKLAAFLKRVDSAQPDCIIFASFLQLCEELVDTRGVSPQAIHELVIGLDNGNDVMTDAELRVLLASAAPSISCGEVEAIVGLLDPDSTGEIRLAELERVLVHHQRPLPEMTRCSVTPRHSGSGRRVRRVRRSTTALGEAQAAEGQGVGQDSIHRHSSTRRQRRSAGGADKPASSLPRLPAPEAVGVGSASGSRVEETDRTFHRTDRSVHLSQARDADAPPSAAIPVVATPVATAAPSTTRRHTRGSQRRRYHSELTNTSIVVDPTPLPSTIRPPDGAATRECSQRDHPSSTGAAADVELPLDSDGRESPHEPFPATEVEPEEPVAADNDAEGSSLRPSDTDAGGRRPAQVQPPKKSKKPFDRCCVVC